MEVLKKSELGITSSLTDLRKSQGSLLLVGAGEGRSVMSQWWIAMWGRDTNKISWRLISYSWKVLCFQTVVMSCVVWGTIRSRQKAEVVFSWSTKFWSGGYCSKTRGICLCNQVKVMSFYDSHEIELKLYRLIQISHVQIDEKTLVGIAYGRRPIDSCDKPSSDNRKPIYDLNWKLSQSQENLTLVYNIQLNQRYSWLLLRGVRCSDKPIVLYWESDFPNYIGYNLK